MSDAELKASNLVCLQRKLKQYGIPDLNNRSIAAALIMDNLANDYPTADLVSAEPFKTALRYLIVSGLTTENGQKLTEKGLRVYNFLE